MRHERSHLSFLTIFLFGLTAGLMTGCSDTVSDRIDAHLVQDDCANPDALRSLEAKLEVLLQ